MSKAPLRETKDVEVPAQAAGDSGSSIALEAPFDGSVAGVTYTPEAAIAGADTNTRRISLVNRGDDGTGATEVAALQFDAGTNGVANDEIALALSGTAADLDVAEGDILEVLTDAVGTGLADPGGRVEVTFERV